MRTYSIFSKGCPVFFQKRRLATTVLIFGDRVCVAAPPYPAVPTIAIFTNACCVIIPLANVWYTDAYTATGNRFEIHLRLCATIANVFYPTALNHVLI